MTLEQSEPKNGAIVTWSADSSWFTAQLPTGHEILMDEPEPTGRNRGPRPTDVLLAAAASCSGISAAAILKKMRQPVMGLEITASGKRQADWPKAYTNILLAFTVLVGEGSNRELIEKAVDLAVRKYCPVSATIESGQGGTAIDYSITVVEAR